LNHIAVLMYQYST